MAVNHGPSLKKRFLKPFQYYAEVSTAHGIRYVGHPAFSIKERLFWLIMLLIHACLASFVCYHLWLKHANAPIHSVVENTHYPLGDLVFPAVTLCPANRINRTMGMELLYRHLERENVNKAGIDLNSILNALIVMKYPTYFNMERHLAESKNYSDVFKSLNLTEFFLQTLPSCPELLEECYWRGELMDCCELFSLQRTEEGFCYAFNSLTPRGHCNCPFIEDPNHDLGNTSSSCKYYHTSSVGSFSGLTAILKKESVPSEVSNDNEDVRGVMVLISSACEHPEAGSGTLFENLPGHTLEVEVTPILFEAHTSIQSARMEYRLCLFPEERHLKFYDFYTEHNCLLECRHQYISKSCYCQPPTFFDPDLPYNSCSVSELICIAKLSSEGKIRKRATVVGPSKQNEDYPDCSCWPSCYRVQYNLKVRRNILSVFNGKERHGILEVHYSSLGAVKYQQQLTFTVEELLIAIGGTGSILMGASMISGTEIVYYSARGIAHFICMIVKKCQERTVPPNGKFTN